MASTVWKGQLSFGFVSMPVKFSSAARAESVSFNQLHRHDHSRVKQVLFCQLEDKAIPRSEIVKGYEYEKDKYIVMGEDEMAQLAPETAEAMEVLEFVKAAEVDPVYFENGYHLAPEKGGERAYALLLAVLRKTGMVAITKIAMHQREHVAVLRPGATASGAGIVLQTLFYHDEVRAAEFRSDIELVKPADLEIACGLAGSMAAAWQPEKYKDSYRDKLAELVQAKAAGKSLEKGAKKGRKSQVIDIQEALRLSVEAAKKKKPAAVAGKKRNATA
jgi:DNA end-binding protein Ku